MFPYLIIFLIVAMLFYSVPQKQSGLVTVFLLVFIGLSGFRDMIGGFDVYIYAEVYEYYKGLSVFLYSPFEKGFLSYYYVLKFFSDKREFMFISTSLIMTILHYFNFKKYSPNIGISLYIYFCKFFLFSFVYLRQGLAMGIIWLSLMYIIKKKYWLIFIICFIAFNFHRSSLIFMPFLFFCNYKFNTFKLGIIAFIVLFISITPLSDYLLASLSEVDNSGKLAVYSELSGGINYFYLFEGSIGVYLSINFQKYFYKSRETTIIGNGFYIYSILILAILTNATFVRFSWYYFIFVVIALPYIYNFYKFVNVQFKPIFKNLLFIYYALVFFRLLIVYDNGDFIPYKSIFQDFDRNGKWEFMEYRKN